MSMLNVNLYALML